MAQSTKEQRRKKQLEAALAVFESEALERERSSVSSCYFDAEAHMVVIKFNIGSEYRIPSHLIEGLGEATDQQVSNIEISPSRSALRWPDLDIDLSVPFLLKGIFGTKDWMSRLGEKGGRSRSAAKRAASRANGAKGGRPRKERNVTMSTGH